VRCSVFQCAAEFGEFVAESAPGMQVVLQVCCRCVAVRGNLLHRVVFL